MNHRTDCRQQRSMRTLREPSSPQSMPSSLRATARSACSRSPTTSGCVRLCRCMRRSPRNAERCARRSRRRSRPVAARRCTSRGGGLDYASRHISAQGAGCRGRWRRQREPDDVRRVLRQRKSRHADRTVALSDPLDRDSNPNRLRQLAEASGGTAFDPKDASRVVDVCVRQIARDIRNTYTTGYVPALTSRDGRFRRVRVEAKGPDGRKLSVRTRAGYAAVEQ